MNYWKLFLIFFITELIIFAGVSSLHISNSSLLSSFSQQRNSIVSEPYVDMLMSIFLHNLLVATIEFVPIIGVIFFIVSIASTGLVVAVEGTAAKIPGIAIFAELMTLPHSWLELPAYAVATASTVYLFTHLSNLKETFYKILTFWGFVALELFIAATFESAEIVVESSNILLSYVFWIPAIPVIYLLYKLLRKIDSPKRKQELPLQNIYNQW
ncbi:hypothetical protein HS7_01840 [Sulfolobales archaeon HS-7]|nr:hypothetical protein HS7_01840 [Sulfolobales archaeon HS-7]